MTADSSRLPPDGTDLAIQWAVNIVPPLLVLLDLQLGYMLVDRSCIAGDRATTHLVHGALLVAALALGMLALRSWGRAGIDWPGDEGDRVTRSRFLALLGLLESAGSALVIVAQWMPAFFLSPCQ